MDNSKRKVDIHSLSIRACQLLSVIPKGLSSIAVGQKPTVVDQLGTIIYVQQAKIEALERAINQLSRGSDFQREVADALKIQNPNCGIEPDDDTDVEG